MDGKLAGNAYGILLMIKHTSNLQLAQKCESVSHHFNQVEYMQPALNWDLPKGRSFRAVWGSLVVAAKLDPKAGDRLPSA